MQYRDMKCSKQLLFNKIPITSILEVHLNPEYWKRLKMAAINRNCTFSWVTRYCVFRLARKKDYDAIIAMKFHSNLLKPLSKDSTKYHRHVICLYGEDEKLIKMAALKVNMSISAFIRLSLYLFLPKIEKFLVKWYHIYSYGTKLCKLLSYQRHDIHGVPERELIIFTRWGYDEFWKRPCRFFYYPCAVIKNET